MKILGIIPVAILLALLVSLSGPLPAVGGGTFAYLTPAELKEMVERREPGLVVIDSRSAGSFEQERIPGAISLPLGDMEQDASLPKLPKEALLVFYCSGTT